MGRESTSTTPAATPQSVDRCMSVRQMAKWLSVSTAKVLAWIRSGKLKAINTSSSPRRPQYRITPDAIREFTNAQTVPTSRPERRRQERRPPGWVDRY